MNAVGNYIAVGCLISAMIFLILIALVCIVRRQRKIRVLSQKVSALAYQCEILTIRLGEQNHTLSHVCEDLSENLGQLLAVAKINLSVLEDDPASSKAMKNSVKETGELLGRMIVLIRDIAGTLEKDFLSKYGLIQTLHVEAERARSRGAMKMKLICQGERYALSLDAELVLLSIVQDFIRLSANYLKASGLEVTISYLADQVTLSLRCEPMGINPQDSGRMAELETELEIVKRRVRLIRGLCSLHLDDRQQMLLTLIIPGQYRK